MRLYFIIAIAISYALDSLRDAYIFGDKNTVRIVNKWNWHVLKNISIILMFSAGYCAAVYSQSVIHGAYLLVMVSPLLLQIWEAVYSYAVYGDPFRDRETFHIVEWRFKLAGVKLWAFRAGCIGAFVALLYLEGRIF